MGIEDDVRSSEPTAAELRVGGMIASLAQDPTDDARARIMAAVHSAPMPATAPPRRIALGSRWRLALVGFGATGLLLSASAGALAASSDALPNSPAYGLRGFEENLRVVVANPRQQPRLRLQFAAEKLRQAETEIRRGNVRDAAKLLSDSKHDLAEAQAELKNINDPAEVMDLAGEGARLHSDAVTEQGQVQTIVNGGTVVSPLSPPSPTPGDESNAPAPEAPLLPTDSGAPPENHPGPSGSSVSPDAPTP